MGNGSRCSPRLGMGNECNACPKRGWAMAPLLPLSGDGLWDREGCALRGMY